MTNPIHVVLLLVLLSVYLVPAVLVGRLADRRGRSFTVYLIASLIVGWIIPLVAVLVLTPRRASDPSR